MFCAKCGILLEDNITFCPDCGTAVADTKTTSFSKILKNRTVLLLLSVVAVAALVILLVSGNSVNASPEKLAAAAVESEYEADAEKMLKCFPDFTVREIARDGGLQEDASRRAVAEKIKADYRYYTPQEVEIVSATVTKTCTADEYLYSYSYAYSEYDHLTAEEYAAIDQVAEVDVVFTKAGEYDSVEVVCIKMDNKWYLLRG